MSDIELSKRTVLKELPNKHHGKPMQLVHRTTGIEVAGSGYVKVNEAWGVLYPETRSGQWYALESVARQVFDDRSIAHV